MAHNSDRVDLTKSWVDYLRSASRQLSCPVCNEDVQPPNINGFKAHVHSNAANHPRLQDDAEIQEAFEKMKLNSPRSPSTTLNSRKRPGPPALENQDDSRGLGRPNPSAPSGAAENDERDNKKLCSPHNSPPSTPPNRRRGKHVDKPGDFDRGAKAAITRHLWTPDDGPLPRTPQTTTRVPQPAVSGHAVRSPQARHHGRQQSPQRQHPESPQPQAPEDPSVSRMVPQLDTRTISQEQLVAEVKGIYAGLVMVESKCIEVDTVQSSSRDALRQLSNQQWQALIALHRTLLHEHHDFFLASQHPAASPALRRLASKYAMPARMWRHGIHSFLELLRHKLPSSLEPMLTFIYIAYSMMALLYETVPAFEDTWIECLGDLGRYRMAIEDDDIKDRETWTAVSRYWYSKASDKSPTTGRLYHHLAILARPNALQQVFYYTKSLCVPAPFLSARESIMTLFDPVLNSPSPRMEPIDAAFVRVHATLFSGKGKDQLAPSMNQFYELLDGHIGRTTKAWLEAGYYVGISLSCALLGYGDESNVLKCAISLKREEETEVEEGGGSPSEVAPSEAFQQALSFAVRTFQIAVQRWGDMNILPYLHTQLVFLRHMSQFPVAMSYIESRFPWKLTALMLNYLIQSAKSDIRMASPAFPGAPENDVPRPLPEDYAMRGLIYAEEYFPDDWFTHGKIDEEDKYFEQASLTDTRRERILWLGRRIASAGKWLTWHEDGKFSVAPEYDIDVFSMAKAEDAADDAP